ncbi:aminotransferase-like domain-containing protein [Pectinatus haikarae]|uniref:GntR family transcriptional regulator of abcA and norABC n=1 Tax=Pectinatus haikarae TaxID=349096 RepID=A0ABT9Y3M3_9FIRM|nr:PLP-dependent aminotransferase family protein [Pectinatus haikarae]MDQ0202412.1 GntR family transcriptional regulator of abcA and norABC [Pectinatus haikarae]
MNKNGLPVQINWCPDKSSPVPVYKQITAFVCDKISSGEWTAGTQLPSQRRLAELFEVNRSTVVTAMEELASYGILKGSRKAGTQISGDTWSLILPKSLDWGKYINSGTFKANKHILQMINRLEFEPDILRLSTGETDPRLFPHAPWRKILAQLSKKNTVFNYLEASGSEKLRMAIAERMGRRGIAVSPSRILITSGSLQALQLISVCLIKKKSVVYVEAPSYLQSLRIFQSADITLKGIGMDKKGMKLWKIPPAAGNMKQENMSFLYTIPTNHNPTGITMTLDRRKDLMDFCVKKQIPIIEDAAYEELCFEEAVPSLKAIDKNGIVIYLGTASKTLAPGLRVGWLIASEPIIQRLSDAKMQMDYGTSSLSQLVFSEFLTSGFYDKHLAALRKELLLRRDSALMILEKNFSDIASWYIPKGGFYIWLTFSKKISSEKLFFSAAKEKILLNPGNIYDFRPNNSLRISYSYLNCCEFAEAVQKLAIIVRSIMK